MSKEELSQPNPSDRLLRKRDLASLLSCSVRTIERMAQDGSLTRVRVRGAVRFMESEVKKFFCQRGVA
jgi:excisionase family DNA binding protein